MLTNAQIICFAATANSDQSRAFYKNTLGLPLTDDNDFALVFDSAGTMLRVQKVPQVTPAPYTILGWKVPDIVKTVRDLSAAGIAMERYQGMNQDASGIWQSPSGARVAWFKDPDGNLLSLTQW